MPKATEVPATTKPVGKPGDERKYDRKDRSVREHPHHNQGYKGVGKKSKQGGDGAERTAAAVPKKDCCRPHPHAGSGKAGDARKVAPAPKSPFRNA